MYTQNAEHIIIIITEQQILLFVCINSLWVFHCEFWAVAPNGKELKNVKSKVVGQDLLHTEKIELYGEDHCIDSILKISYFLVRSKSSKTNSKSVLSCHVFFPKVKI